ncbi:MAG: hypothetical protein RJA69_807 [Pseudomonadota bacterium]
MSQSCMDVRVVVGRLGAHRLALAVCCALLSAVVLGACAPALNWREVRFDDARWVGWLPCKPDRAQRTVNLGGPSAQLSLMGCQADGMDFTLAQLTLPAGLSAIQAQQAWTKASLASLQAAPDAPSTDWILAGASTAMTPQRVVAQGGQGQSARWAWFAYDGLLYQLAVYAPASRTAQAQQAMDSLISGLRLP